MAVRTDHSASTVSGNVSLSGQGGLWTLDSHGTIIESGTVEEIKKRTDTESLEEAFLKLTGRDIRDDNESGNRVRTIRGMRRRIRH